MSPRIPSRVIRIIDQRRKLDGRYNFRAGWLEQPLQCRVEYRRDMAEQIRSIRQRRTVELAALRWDDFGFIPVTSDGKFIGREPGTDAKQEAVVSRSAAPCPAWREVSKEEFYRVIGPQDVSLSIVNGTWPYTMEFVAPDRQVRGKRVGYLPEGSALESKRYYLPA